MEERGVKAEIRWLVLKYEPTALFSLKLSAATSSVGTSLVLPTPYAIKMAFVDAAFRAGLPEAECAVLVRALRDVDVRIKPPQEAVVTHTFVKVRQESRQADPDHPYTSNIAYREVVFFSGQQSWAFDASGSATLHMRLVDLAPLVTYIGKRGSFLQFVGWEWREQLDGSFTQPLANGPWQIPARCHVRALDDFGPEATLERLSSYSPQKVERGRHRIFVDTLIPLGVVNAGPGFSHYTG
ncbi:MAG: hypothetical protein RDU89_11500 [bacterium]|nr:hypothetical protein [bacterium]